MSRKRPQKLITPVKTLIYFILFICGISTGYLLAQTRVPDISVDENITIKDTVSGKELFLIQTPLAVNAKLDGITGVAVVDIDGGEIKINVDLKNLILPEQTKLHAYLVDAGINGGPGKTSSSDSDEKYGIFFNNLSYKGNIDLSPFVQPLGILNNEFGIHTLTFSLPNSNFYGFDSIIITLESFDQNESENDPRPGPIILSGLI